MYWYCKGKLCLGHLWESKGQNKWGGRWLVWHRMSQFLWSLVGFIKMALGTFEQLQTDRFCKLILLALEVTHDRMWTSLVFTCCCYFRINTTARVSELISDSTMLLIHDTVKLDEYKAIPTYPLILSLVDDPLINTVFIIVSCMHMLQHSYFLRHWLEAQVLLIPVSAFLFPFVQ